MRVDIYLPEDNAEHETALLSFATGLNRLGNDVDVKSIKSYCSSKAPDIAVIFGTYKKVVPAAWWRGRVFEGQRQMGKDTIVIEKGFIKRADYYMVGLNGLNNRADFKNKGMPSDRFDALGIDIKENVPGDYILVCGQVPWDANVQHTDHLQWMGQVVFDLQQTTKRDIVLRPHPNAADYTPMILGAETMIGGTIEEAIEGAHAVVTFNSNSGVDALLAGKPVYSFDKGSMVYNISSHNVAGIDLPYIPDPGLVKLWANDIAYAQWTFEEMKEGLPWLHLIGED